MHFGFIFVRPRNGITSAPVALILVKKKLVSEKLKKKTKKNRSLFLAVIASK